MKRFTSLPLFAALSALLAYQVQAASDNSPIDNHLVTFSPEIRITNETHPCQGVRVSDTRLLTAPACATRMKVLLHQVDAIEVMDTGQQSTGQVRQLSDKAINEGQLTLTPWAESDNRQIYPDTGNHLPDTDSPLTITYLAPDKEGGLVANHRAIQSGQYSRQGAGEDNLFIFHNNLPLPLGAPVSLDGSLVCVLTGVLAGKSVCRGAVSPQPWKRTLRSVKERQAGAGNAKGCRFTDSNILGWVQGDWACNTCTDCGCSGGCEISGIGEGCATYLECTCDDGSSCGTIIGDNLTTGCWPDDGNADAALGTVAATLTLLLTLLVTHLF